MQNRAKIYLKYWHLPAQKRKTETGLPPQRVAQTCHQKRRQKDEKVPYKTLRGRTVMVENALI